MNLNHSRTALVTILLAVLAAVSGAQSLTPAQSQEKADKILDRFLTLTGELEALKNQKSRRDRGRMSLTQLGISGEVEILAKAPNKMRMTMKIAGIGEIVEGFDGTTAWVQDPIQGYREKTGLELAATSRQADYYMAANYKTHYPKREWISVDTLNGVKVDKVRLHPAEGAPETWFIAQDSGLLLRMDSISHLPQGDIESQVYLENYKMIDGTMEPMRIRVVNPLAPVTMELTTSETNVELDDALFASPRKKGPEEIIIVQE
jgi:outer membrane lipoprotein-sorting protein